MPPPLDPDQALSNWMELNVMVMTMTEEEVAKLLAHEREHRGRLRIMLRLYNRFSKLRSMREKKEIAHNAKA